MKLFVIKLCLQKQVTVVYKAMLPVRPLQKKNAYDKSNGKGANKKLKFFYFI